MSRLRVLMIGRHYWPHGSIDSASFLAQTACALHRNGIHVEVVTPRFASSWPEQLQVREIAVHRPVAVPRSDWSMGRYVRHLSNWLHQHGARFDLFLVDAIRDEAVAAIGAARAIGIPTLLRCGGWGADSDTLWWPTSRAARKCAVAGKTAEAVIAKSAVCQRSLIAAGVSASRIVRIDEGFAPAPARTAKARGLARATLAEVNGDLFAAEKTPVVLCASRLTRSGGINLLAKAAPHLILRHPELQLWLIGDGPYRDWIYEYLRGEGVRASIAMPGSFCDFEDLYAAADVFLQPDESGLDFFLPSAVSAGLPIVTVDNRSTRAIFRSDSTGKPGGSDVETLVEWCPEPTAKQVRLGLTRTLSELAEAQVRASELRRLLLRSRPQSDSIGSYIALMEKLVRQRQSTSTASSIKAVS